MELGKCLTRGSTPDQITHEHIKKNTSFVWTIFLLNEAHGCFGRKSSSPRVNMKSSKFMGGLFNEGRCKRKLDVRNRNWSLTIGLPDTGPYI